MIVLKKNDLLNALLTIASFNEEGSMTSGLLSENVSLGLKRRLQKIRASVLVKYNEFLEDKMEVDKLSSEDKIKELDLLLDEDVNIDCEMVDIKMIEAIETKNVYDFELIEKIAK